MRARTVGLVGVALGLGILGVVGLLLSPVPDAEYALHSVERTDTTGIDTVQYARLPTAGQQAFTAALEEGGPVGLSNERAIQRFRENQAIVYEGTVYEYELGHVDGSQVGIVRALTVSAGATLVGIGLLMGLRDQFRPLTTTTAILAGGLPLLALVGLAVYEGVIQSDIGVPLVFGAALPASFVAVVTGTAVRQRDMVGAVLGSVLAIGTVLVSALLGWGSLFTLLFLPLLSVPWFSLGYLFAQPASASTASLSCLCGRLG